MPLVGGDDDGLCRTAGLSPAVAAILPRPSPLTITRVASADLPRVRRRRLIDVRHRYFSVPTRVVTLTRSPPTLRTKSPRIEKEADRR